jgi:pilus assembly protein FimV
MTEVGTKLDLARAYLDMGDPDGARSILNEVIEEGDPAQRQEARQLLDSLDS